MFGVTGSSSVGVPGSSITTIAKEEINQSINLPEKFSKTPVVYHLPKNSGNFGWDVNGKTVLVCPYGNFPK